ncbi:MAG: DNA polymerase III subunit delta [Pyrinomonadaceae bacterium]
MPKQTRDDLRTQLRQGELAPVYLLFGPETFLRNQAARAITELTVKNDPLREFNDVGFSLLTDPLNDALSAAEQMPMMGSRRVVRIECVKMKGQKLTEEEENAILQYVQRPAESSVVILLMEEMDKRFKFTKTLQEACYAVEFGVLDEKELEKWTRDRFKELETSIDASTLHHLLSLTGNNVRSVMAEVDKLATAALPAAVVTAELVDQLVPRSREQDNFELTNKLVANDRTGALRILYRMMEDGAEPLMVIGLLASNYHKLVITKELMTQGRPVAEVLKVVGWKPESFLTCARRSDAAKLAHSIKLIADADLAIKTSLATPRMQIELLVFELSARA